MSIILRSLSGQETICSFAESIETLPERNNRLVKTTAIFVAVFVTFLFVPIIHFVVPPLILILGVIYFAKNLSSTKTKVFGTCACPECGNEILISEITSSFPVKTYCSHCRNQLYIEKSEESNASF